MNNEKYLLQQLPTHLLNKIAQFVRPKRFETFVKTYNLNLSEQIVQQLMLFQDEQLTEFLRFDCVTTLICQDYSLTQVDYSDSSIKTFVNRITSLKLDINILTYLKDDYEQTKQSTVFKETNLIEVVNKFTNLKDLYLNFSKAYVCADEEFEVYNETVTHLTIFTNCDNNYRCVNNFLALKKLTFRSTDNCIGSHNDYIEPWLENEFLVNVDLDEADCRPDTISFKKPAIQYNCLYKFDNNLKLSQYFTATNYWVYCILTKQRFQPWTVNYMHQKHVLTNNDTIALSKCEHYPIKWLAVTYVNTADLEWLTVNVTNLNLSQIHCVKFDKCLLPNNVMRMLCKKWKTVWINIRTVEPYVLPYRHNSATKEQTIKFIEIFTKLKVPCIHLYSCNSYLKKSGARDIRLPDIQSIAANYNFVARQFSPCMITSLTIKHDFL